MFYNTSLYVAFCIFMLQLIAVDAGSECPVVLTVNVCGRDCPTAFDCHADCSAVTSCNCSCTASGGLIVGIVIGALILVGLCIYCCCCRRRQRGYFASSSSPGFNSPIVLQAQPAIYTTNPIVQH